MLVTQTYSLHLALFNFLPTIFRSSSTHYMYIDRIRLDTYFIKKNSVFFLSLTIKAYKKFQLLLLNT